MKILLFGILMAIFNMPDTEKNNISNPAPAGQNEGPLFSFGLIADAQYCDCDPAGSRYYRSSLSKLAEAVQVFTRMQVAFAVNLGDLIDRDYGSYEPALKILNSQGLTIHHCAGNHDYAVKPELKSSLPVLLPSRTGYYAFILKKFRMIVLNGNEVSTYASANQEVTKQAASYVKNLKEKGAINAIDWNGGIGKEQALWLENQLKEAVKAGEKVIIFCHFPIAPENIHNLLNYKEIVPIVENNPNIVAWFSGHNHAGNYANQGGVHFITLKGMVETETTNSFAVADIFDDKLVIRGFGNEISQTLIYK